MKKAASIFLRADITQKDVDRMISWMQNPNVTAYLNEDRQIVYFLEQLSATVPEPMMTYHFNRSGRFFLVCLEDVGSIGFVKLVPQPHVNSYEIVYVIGEDALWGQGLGESAIREALAKAFLEWRADKITAKIMPGNHRSIRSVCGCGFREGRSDSALLQYYITQDEYLRQRSARRTD